jgi:hypothetical protein
MKNELILIWHYSAYHLKERERERERKRERKKKREREREGYSKKGKLNCHGVAWATQEKDREELWFMGLQCQPARPRDY